MALLEVAPLSIGMLDHRLLASVVQWFVKQRVGHQLLAKFEVHFERSTTQTRTLGPKA